MHFRIHIHNYPMEYTNNRLLVYMNEYVTSWQDCEFPGERPSQLVLAYAKRGRGQLWKEVKPINS